MQSPKFKLQTSNKFQLTISKLWFLIFDPSLMFGHWSLNFASAGGF